MNSIVERLSKRAIEIPDKVCFIDGGNEVTYKQLWERVKVCAGNLKRFDVGKGDFVLIQAMSNVEHVANVFAIHLIGASAIHYENNCPEERIIELYETTKAKCYISDEEVNIDSLWIKRSFLQEREFCLQEIEFPKSDWIGDIIFTTGTTGKSKGVMLSHRAILAAVENVENVVGLKGDDVTIIPTPMNHTHAIRRTYATVLSGSTTILMNGIANLKTLFENIERYKVNGLYFMPTMMTYVLRLSGDKISEYKQQLRFVELSAAPVAEEDITKICQYLPQSSIFFVYGSTESGCTAGYDIQVTGYKPLAIGHPTTHAKFEFVDDQGVLIDTSVDNPGYIVTIGPMNMSGYYAEPELTREVLVEGKVISSDIGYVNKEGEIILLGRKGDVINMGGIKISSLEIEEVALQWDEILECACIPMRDTTFGEVPQLYVVIKERKEFHKQEFERFLKTKLEWSRVPKEIVQIKELPRTYNGKVKKKGLKKDEE